MVILLMGLDKIESKLTKSFFPREFKQYKRNLSDVEIALIRNAFEKANALEKCDYFTFCKTVICVSLDYLGQYPELEYFAAEIAYEIRRLDDLEFIVRVSNNPYVLLPLAKGLIAKNSLGRAAANIRIVESKIKPDDLVYQLELYLVKSYYAVANGNLTDALFHILAAKEFLRSSENELDIIQANTFDAQILVDECKILFEMGRYDKVFDNVNEGLTLAKKIGNRPLTVLFEIFYGMYLIDYKSSLDEGNQHHYIAASIARKLRNPYLIAITLETIGNNLQLQRKIEEGIKFCKHAERLYKKIGDEQNRMIIAIKIANLQIAFGNVSSAMSILLDLETLGSKNPLTYLNLVYAFIKIDDLDLAETYLEKAKKHLRGRGDLTGEFLLIYYEGLIEFQSGNFGKAEMLFAHAQEFAELNKLSKQALNASLQLVNVLVSKNIAFPSKRNFKKAKFSIVELSSQVKKDEQSIEYNNCELLKAILLFSNNNYQEAKDIFKRLESFYFSIRLFEKISTVQEYLERLSHLEEIGAISLDKTERTTKEFSEFEKTPAPILPPNVEPPQSYIEDDANPILLLILSHGGLPIYSHYFREGFENLDETLVSGFLGAIVSFAEKLGESNIRQTRSGLGRGFLQGIRHGDFEILLERSERYLIALVADQENYLIRKQLKRLVDEINVLFLIDDEPIIVLGENNRLYIQSVVNRIF